MSEITKAIIEVMKAVDSIGKNLNVGFGSNSYKGVADKDVKEAYNSAMAANGLCILPIEIKPKTTIHRWEEGTQYKKQKMNVFTEVETKYLLMHTSGESKEIAGYGHGIDSQDKSAGKATTYALKYALLYTFMTPTGLIDDTDNHHSEPKLSIKDALNDMRNVKTETERGIVWNKYIEFKNNAEFVKATKDKASEIINQNG